MRTDHIIIDGKEFSSRLIMGTALYPNLKILNECLTISKTEIITVAMRRLDIASKEQFFENIESF